MVRNWRKSSYSDNEQGACVEMGFHGERVGVRDSVDPEGPKLSIPKTALAQILGQVKAGQLDL